MENINTLNNILNKLLLNQEDIIKVSTILKNLNITYYYIPNVCPIKEFDNFYIEKINDNNYSNLTSIIPGVVIAIKEYTDTFLSYNLNRGNMIIVINNYSYIFNIANPIKRTPSKNELDPTNLLDGKEGFIENVYDNLSFIKKRIKSSDLIVRKYILGSLTQTDTFLIYLKHSENSKHVKECIQKLSTFNHESMISINDLNSLFNKSMLLPLTFNTGSPDYVVGALLEGRAIIIIDNTPLALVMPTTLSLFTTIKNETNAPTYYTIINRLFIIFFFFLSLFLLPLFIALINFNPTFFSTLFMANIQLNERGTTFPFFIESVLILFMFEFYRLTTSRSPTNYVQNIVIIFGGLFIGQNAINSGLVGSSVLLLTSISYISSFGISNNPELITSFNIFRIYNIILAYIMGIIGFSIGLITTILYMINQKSSGHSFLSPFIPFDKKKVKAFFMPKHGDNNEKE